MAFKYDLPAAQQTPTSDSKVVLSKSFKINIAAGAGFTTATAYSLGWLPKDAQVVGGNISVTTTTTGGTVSAATIAVTVGGVTVATGVNTFTATLFSTAFAHTAITTRATGLDQEIKYTPTLTGAGATAGVIYVTLQYVV